MGNSSCTQRSVECSYTDEDVLFGRGACYHNHVGNKRFRDMAKKCKLGYKESPEKKKYAYEFAKYIQRDGAKFLKRDYRLKWVEVDEEQKIEKCMQALRKRPLVTSDGDRDINAIEKKL